MTTDRPAAILSATIVSKRLPPWLVKPAREATGQLLGFADFNLLYANLPPCDASDFARTILHALRTRVEAKGVPIASLPCSGPLMVVANPPLGFLDGMVLDALLSTVRPDVSIVAADVFAAIPELRQRHIFVSFRGNRRRRGRSTSGLRQAIEWLRGGRTLVIFPAGQVSRFQWQRGGVCDCDWSPHIAAIARRTKAVVLPVYLHGRASLTLLALGGLAPMLQNLRSIAAVAHHRGSSLRATFGQLISPDELAAFSSENDAITFLRQRTEELAKPHATA